MTLSIIFKKFPSQDPFLGDKTIDLAYDDVISSF
jgi:hypothetical protein